MLIVQFLPIDSTMSPLSVVLIDPHVQPSDSGTLVAHACSEFGSDPPRQTLGRRVFNRQQLAVPHWKNPSLIAERSNYLRLFSPHANHGMKCRQQYTVVKSFDDIRQTIAKGNEIDDILVFIQRTFDFRLDAVIVTMQALADVACKGNKMSRAKDQLFFLKYHSVRCI